MRITSFPDDPSMTDASPANVPRFLAVDFFCGAGGTTRGMIDAGGYVMAGVDKDAQCERTFVENNRNTTIDARLPVFLNRNIFAKSEDCPEGEKAELIADLTRMIGHYRTLAPDAPLMFAICAPCQPFTGLSRKTLSQERSQGRARDRNLLLEAAEMVELFKPEIVLSENVAGIRDKKFGGVWQEFRQRLDRAGYATGTEMVSTDNYGIPQMRKRSILIGVRRDASAVGDLLEIPVPLHDAAAKRMTVAEAIGHYPAIKAGEIHPEIPNHRASPLTETNIQRIRSLKPGENNDKLGKTDYGDLALPCHKRAKQKNGKSHGIFPDVYTRMSPDKVAPTITTHCHSISNGRFGHYDMSQDRAISLREAAAIQSFRDDYIFHPVEKTTIVARQIGNAVPPRLAEFFSDYAVKVLQAEKMTHFGPVDLGALQHSLELAISSGDA